MDQSKLWEQIKYFKPCEFEDPGEPGSGAKMNIEFIRLLDLIRGDCGYALVVNSGYRSVIHNIAVGGKTNSAHMKGLAADIACTNSSQRYEIVKSALRWGIRRIGIGETFVHLDMSMDLPQDCLWLYPKGATATNQKEA